LAPIAEPVETRRGTQSLGLAILRIVAGAVLLISGLQTLFGFAGDPGISALESRLSFFSGSGVLAVAIPAAEVIAGGLLILGLLTPFAAALAFVVSAFVATFHLSGHQGSLWPYGLNPVIHQWALYALISLSLIFTGPGGASLDRSRSWATRPLASSWIFALLGIAGFAALWLLTGGRNPF
ncbi:DoxX family protein, partial [Corynebacterium sp.]|uniref:DoxX family protein n=1 Tax=Corynebacterium sp. TaxID=1720 RepID=UPI002F421546